MVQEESISLLRDENKFCHIGKNNEKRISINSFKEISIFRNET